MTSKKREAFFTKVGGAFSVHCRPITTATGEQHPRLTRLPPTPATHPAYTLHPRSLRPSSPHPAGNGDSTMQSLHSAITAPCNHLLRPAPPTSQQVEKSVSWQVGKSTSWHTPPTTSSTGDQLARPNVPPHPPPLPPGRPPPISRGALASTRSAAKRPTSLPALAADSTLQSLHNAITPPPTPSSLTRG